MYINVYTYIHIPFSKNVCLEAALGYNAPVLGSGLLPGARQVLSAGAQRPGLLERGWIF